MWKLFNRDATVLDDATLNRLFLNLKKIAVGVKTLSNNTILRDVLNTMRVSAKLYHYKAGTVITDNLKTFSVQRMKQAVIDGQRLPSVKQLFDTVAFKIGDEFVPYALSLRVVTEGDPMLSVITYEDETENFIPGGIQNTEYLSIVLSDNRGFVSFDLTLPTENTSHHIIINLESLVIVISDVNNNYKVTGTSLISAIQSSITYNPTENSVIIPVTQYVENITASNSFTLKSVTLSASAMEIRGIASNYKSFSTILDATPASYKVPSDTTQTDTIYEVGDNKTKVTYVNNTFAVKVDRTVGGTIYTRYYTTRDFTLFLKSHFVMGHTIRLITDYANDTNLWNDSLSLPLTVDPSHQNDTISLRWLKEHSVESLTTLDEYDAEGTGYHFTYDQLRNDFLNIGVDGNHYAMTCDNGTLKYRGTLRGATFDAFEVRPNNDFKLGNELTTTVNIGSPNVFHYKMHWMLFRSADKFVKAPINVNAPIWTAVNNSYSAYITANSFFQAKHTNTGGTYRVQQWTVQDYCLKGTTMYIGTSSGVYRITRTSTTLNRLKTPRHRFQISSMFIDDDGKLHVIEANQTEWVETSTDVLTQQGRFSNAQVTLNSKTYPHTATMSVSSEAAWDLTNNITWIKDVEETDDTRDIRYLNPSYVTYRNPNLNATSYGHNMIDTANYMGYAKIIVGLDGSTYIHNKSNYKLWVSPGVYISNGGSKTVPPTWNI